METTNSLDIIRERVMENYRMKISGKFFPIRGAASAAELENMSVPGCCEGALRFNFIDYTNNNGSSWPLAEAAAIAYTLSVYQETVVGEEREAAFRLIKGILRDFAGGEYINPNWWWNEIGIPERISSALLFVKDFLDEDLLAGALKVVENGSVLVRDEIIKVKSAYHTGGNLASYCTISINHACVINSSEELRLVVDALSEETYGAKEGLQPDGSFFQHGRRLYTFSYGTLYLTSFAEFSVIMAGTEFEFPTYAKENVIRYLLDGARHMIGATSCNISATGRGYTRAGNPLSITPIIEAARDLLKNKDLPRRAEVLDMLQRMEQGRQPYLGVKYFDCARFLTLHTPNLHLSFKGSDPSIFNAEICTEENGLAVNMSYGRVTFFVRYGNEYVGISPLWDYSYIPGTTTPEESDEELVAKGDFTWHTVNTDCYGGRVIGDIGVSFIGGEDYGVSSTVSAFALPFGMVLLGCGISDSEGRDLHTTVNQCLSTDTVKVEKDGKEIIYGGILYRNLDEETEFKYKTDHRAYSYRRNTRPNTNNPIEGDVFTLYIPTDKAHGAYAYMVCEEELSESSVEVLRNDLECQAIRIPGGRTVAVFHKNGKHKVGEKEIFAVKNEVKIF